MNCKHSSDAGGITQPHFDSLQEAAWPQCLYCEVERLTALVTDAIGALKEGYPAEAVVKILRGEDAGVPK